MITGVILARNEADNILACISALRPHVEEIILIDMESTDNTVGLARPYVDKLLSHRLVAEFDAVRNVAIPEARHEWLWFVDADERIPARAGQLVRQIIHERGREMVAIHIPFKSYFCGKWIEYSGWWPGYTAPRVLKRGHFKFAQRLHGGVDVSGPQYWIPPDPTLGIEHYSYRSVEHYVEKVNRYTSTEADQSLREGKIWDWQVATRYMMHDLWLYYERKQGVLDGEHGWILAWLSGQYRWLQLAKVWDLCRSGQVDGHNAPAHLDEVLRVMEDELARLRAAHPVPPFDVVWRSPIWDLSGYADEGRVFAKALAAGERPLVLEDIRWNATTCELPLGDRTLLRALTGRRRGRSCVTITDCIPSLVEPDPCAAVNILRTTFETDRIPLEWLGHIEPFDEVWVISEHNRTAFLRGGVAPERLRVIPSGLDSDVYRPDGPTRGLPGSLQDRFVFLSVFDWQLRKGWDVLLRAYVATFAANEGVGLLLKISRVQGQQREAIERQADEVLRGLGTSLTARADIVLMDEPLTMLEMAALYRSVGAFVLPSRGEGWGRPLMEAMACGLPTIGTGASGNIDFMTRENSFLIGATPVPVPAEGVREVPPYAGQQWLEPDAAELAKVLRQVFTDAPLRAGIAQQGCRDIHARFDLASIRRTVQAALADVESRSVSTPPPDPDPAQIRVQIEGEFFAGHSFANINEVLAAGFLEDAGFAVSLDRRVYNPTTDHRAPGWPRLRPYFGRTYPDGPDVVIRHAFPPAWDLLPAGKWVHIQPWEYGHLPAEWVGPLVDRVDEIWAPSTYVRDVYVRSGVPAEKIVVIPWGVHPHVFHPDVVPRCLPTAKTFKFLFVGGVIERKGFDTLLSAYLEEFGPEDDVVLVIKDMGANSFYRGSPLRERLEAARNDPRQAAIVCLDGDFTPGQLSGLYAACDCLVAPYRGEGFGLPILEAMACGTVPIVPRGGASDDFVSARTAYLLPSKEVETTHSWPLCGPPLELEIQVQDLRRVMRQVVEHPEVAERKGRAAARHVAAHFTWRRTIDAMAQRIRALAEPQRRRSTSAPSTLVGGGTPRPTFAACLRVENDGRALAECLARVAPFVDELVVVDAGSTDRSAAIAREYGARVVESVSDAAVERAVTAEWMCWLQVQDRLAPGDAEQIRPLVSAQPAAVSELTMHLAHSHMVEHDGRAPQALVLVRAAHRSAQAS